MALKWKKAEKKYSKVARNNSDDKRLPHLADDGFRSLFYSDKWTQKVRKYIEVLKKKYKTF